MSNKNKKSSWQTFDEYQNQKLKEMSGATVTEAEVKKFKDSMAKDPYTSRNEFKPGFYNQKDKPATTVETVKGTGATAPNVTDTESFVEGGMSRGQKAIQVKKVQFRGVF
jgi:hypothetical protein